MSNRRTRDRNKQLKLGVQPPSIGDLVDSDGENPGEVRRLHAHHLARAAVWSQSARDSASLGLKSEALLLAKSEALSRVGYAVAERNNASRTTDPVHPDLSKAPLSPPQYDPGNPRAYFRLLNERTRESDARGFGPRPRPQFANDDGQTPRGEPGVMIPGSPRYVSHADSARRLRRLGGPDPRFAAERARSQFEERTKPSDVTDKEVRRADVATWAYQSARSAEVRSSGQDAGLT